MTQQQLTTNKMKDYTKIIIPSHHVLWSKEDESTGGVTVCVDIQKIIDIALDQNNKEWLKRVEGLKNNKISNETDPDTRSFGYSLAVKQFNSSIDNLVNNFKEGKE